MNALLTTPELAKVLNISTRHLFRLKDELPHVKLGRSLRWEADRVVAVLRIEQEK